MKKQLEIITDHFQFYVGDSQLWEKVDTTALWKNSKSRVVLSEGLIGVGTARFGGKTKVMVVIDENQNIDGWKTIGDLHLSLPSGKMLIWSPEKTNSEGMISIDVKAGNYVGKVLSRGEETISDEVAETGDDEYTVILKSV